MKKLSLFILISAAFVYVSCNSSKKSITEKTTEVTTSNSRLSLDGEFMTGGTIGWEAANDRYSADGKFEKWHFTQVNIEDDNIETLNAQIAVDLASIWEKSDGLTEHLKAPDFFNIAKFTTATIDIMNVKKQADGSYMADMKLNMKGLTQDLTSTFNLSGDNHVTGTAEVNRTFFGLGGAKLGTGDMIKVNYDTDIPMD